MNDIARAPNILLVLILAVDVWYGLLVLLDIIAAGITLINSGARCKLPNVKLSWFTHKRGNKTLPY